ncbi:pilus assembly protein [Gleimia sp. 6138-11-ORH1]|uniref:TadE/TadG family type IV pilus assembly protein n=1 Tax=Gleimia sp. 6138-11-ORH1 TaxID=2973937 RepID=UPI002169521F|nr:TadE/TadG family type IV pilus assembly protein [Gleimia sp. 6138-11-ORH1]MCS4483986.1 pilus assembly protein [Gleimia sp. 6138-11-ORH1]
MRERMESAEESGSEVVSHALVQVLVLILVSALLQLGFVLYTRNVAVDAASEGARYYSLQGASLERTYARIEALLSGGLGTGERQILITERKVADRVQVVVQVSTDLPILGPWGVPRALTVEASVWRLP